MYDIVHQIFYFLKLFVNITFILFQMLKIPDSLTIEYFLNDLGLGLQKGFQHSTQIVLFRQEYDFLNEGLKIEDFR